MKTQLATRSLNSRPLDNAQQTQPLSSMVTFSHQDIEDYYDQTEVHYGIWWDLKSAKGMHYGVWNEQTKSISEAVMHLNQLLSQLTEIEEGARVLDAGCGIGGSSFYLAETKKCVTTGVTLSQRQVDSASRFAAEKGLEEVCQFMKCSYTNLPCDEQSFDVSWAIESLGSATNKEDFFAEMHRVLKPNGKILIADTFKSFAYPISENKDMQMMLNPWAISDILSADELIALAQSHGFKLVASKDVTKQIKKSVNRMYWAALAGMIGTKLYNSFKNASRFSKIHYKSGLAQKKTYQRGDWKYMLFAFEKA